MYNIDELEESAITVITGGRGKRSCVRQACVKLSDRGARVVIPPAICVELGWDEKGTRLIILELPNGNWVIAPSAKGNAIQRPTKGSRYCWFNNIKSANEEIKTIPCTVDCNILVLSSPLRKEN